MTIAIPSAPDAGRIELPGGLYALPYGDEQTEMFTVFLPNGYDFAFPVRRDKVLAAAALAAPKEPAGEAGGDDDADEAYRIGKRDGYAEAVQDLDCLTGGDGEYLASTFPGESCPDPEAMKRRIVERFEALTPTTPPSAAPGVVPETSSVLPVKAATIGRHLRDLRKAHPEKFTAAQGKPALRGWFSGQIMRLTDGRANYAFVEEIVGVCFDALAPEMPR